MRLRGLRGAHLGTTLTASQAEKTANFPSVMVLLLYLMYVSHIRPEQDTSTSIIHGQTTESNCLIFITWSCSASFFFFFLFANMRSVSDDSVS